MVLCAPYVTHWPVIGPGRVLTADDPCVRCVPMGEHLELPRPLRLLRTIAWSLGESAGLPIVALAIGSWLGGRDVGLLAGVAATWVIAIIRKIATGSVPGLLAISAILLTVQTAVVIATGALWIFLLHFVIANALMAILFARGARGPDPLLARLAAEVVGLRQPARHHPGLHRFFRRGTLLWSGVFAVLAACLAVLMVSEPVKLFLVLTTVATAGLIAVGAGASALWLLFVLRRHGLKLRFAPA
jgi:uncharacterized membrane protein